MDRGQRSEHYGRLNIQVRADQHDNEVAMTSVGLLNKPRFGRHTIVCKIRSDSKLLLSGLLRVYQWVTQNDPQVTNVNHSINLYDHCK